MATAAAAGGVAARVEGVLGQGEQREQSGALSKLADELADGADPNGLCELVTAVARDAVPLVVSRPVLDHVAGLLTRENSKLDADAVTKLAEHGLEAVKERRVAFDEVDAKLREALGQVLAEGEHYVEAARVLSAINVDSGRFSDSDKARHYVRITELFLEQDETVEAERFVNRAGQFVYSCNDPMVQVRHQVSYARILDSKRKFLEAAQRYYQLSTDTVEVDGNDVAEEDLLHLLFKAVTCALLASAGPQRTRMLNMLYKDERARNFGSHWPVLEKMYMERILTKPEVETFEKTLEPHQRAILSDGSTVLDRAMKEHNILAASRLYENISLTELANLLGVEPAQAESLVSRMIKENRLEGRIDQVDEVLTFPNAGGALLAFDARIQELCHAVNGAVDAIAARHPDLADPAT